MYPGPIPISDNIVYRCRDGASCVLFELGDPNSRYPVTMARHDVAFSCTIEGKYWHKDDIENVDESSPRWKKERHIYDIVGYAQHVITENT